jgi:hypothetical protein
MVEVTVLEVIKKKNKVWVITRCDSQPELVGEVTGSGVPCRAKDAPIGTTYQMITTFPESKKGS